MAIPLIYHAVLFDLDGTLLDTAEDLGLAVNAVLASLGYPTHELPVIRSFIGKGIKEFTARFFQFTFKIYN
jgi:phosphoglycolate phosphatase